MKTEMKGRYQRCLVCSAAMNKQESMYCENCQRRRYYEVWHRPVNLNNRMEIFQAMHETIVI